MCVCCMFVGQGGVFGGLEIVMWAVCVGLVL